MLRKTYGSSDAGPVNHMDKRSYERYSFEGGILYSYNNRMYPGRAINISKGGIRFKTEHPVPPLTKLALSLQQDPEIVFPGITVWANGQEQDYAVGMIFESLSQDQAYSLDMLLRQVAA